MGARQHGNLPPLPGQGRQRGDDGIQGWNQYGLPGFFKGQRHGCVIDILAGKPEMDEFFERGKIQRVKFLL